MDKIIEFLHSIGGSATSDRDIQVAMAMFVIMVAVFLYYAMKGE